MKGKGNPQIVRYSDAEWVGSPSDKQSVTGYYVIF